MTAKHFDEGKPRVDLLPMDAIMIVAGVFSAGAGKYGERNWEQGMPWGKLLGSSLRHLYKWSFGHDRDEETGLSHLAHAAACILMLLAYWTRGRIDLDDRWVPGADDQKPVRAILTSLADSEGGMVD